MAHINNRDLKNEGRWAMDPTNYVRYSAILWDIPAGQDWQAYATQHKGEPGLLAYPGDGKIGYAHESTEIGSYLWLIYKVPEGLHSSYPDIKWQDDGGVYTYIHSVLYKKISCKLINYPPELPPQDAETVGRSIYAYAEGAPRQIIETKTVSNTVYGYYLLDNHDLKFDKSPTPINGENEYKKMNHVGQKKYSYRLHGLDSYWNLHRDHATIKSLKYAPATETIPRVADEYSDDGVLGLWGIWYVGNMDKPYWGEFFNDSVGKGIRKYWAHLHGVHSPDSQDWIRVAKILPGQFRADVPARVPDRTEFRGVTELPTGLNGVWEIGDATATDKGSGALGIPELGGDLGKSVATIAIIIGALYVVSQVIINKSKQPSTKSGDGYIKTFYKSKLEESKDIRKESREERRERRQEMRREREMVGEREFKSNEGRADREHRERIADINNRTLTEYNKRKKELDEQEVELEQRRRRVVDIEEKKKTDEQIAELKRERDEAEKKREEGEKQAKELEDGKKKRDGVLRRAGNASQKITKERAKFVKKSEKAKKDGLDREAEELDRYVLLMDDVISRLNKLKRSDAEIDDLRRESGDAVNRYNSIPGVSRADLKEDE